MSEVDSFALPSCSEVESFALPSRAHHHIEWEEEDLLPVPRPREVRQAASSFSIGTSAIDGWRPRNFAAMSDEALEAMGLLIVMTEQQGGFPDTMAEFLIRLIPKPVSGRRPVALFKAAVRMWYKVRQKICKAWLKFNVQESAINLNTGRQVGDAVYRDLVRALIGEKEGRVTVEVNMDGEKFFDNIKHHILHKQAKAVGYPMVLLRVSLATYRARRALVGDHQMISPMMRASQGAAAGSAHATFEATAVLLLEVRAHLLAFPTSGLSIHVEDFKESASSSETGAAVVELCCKVASLVEKFEINLELPFGKEKTNIIGSSKEVTRLAAEGLGVWAGGCEEEGSVKRLGYDYQLGSRMGRTPTVALQRIGKGRGRCLRFRSLLGRKKLCYSPIFTAGVLPAALFGAETLPLPGKVLKRLRNDGLRAAGVRFAGADTDVLSMCINPKACPEFKAAAAPILRWAREWWMTGQDMKHKPKDCLTVIEMVKAHEAGKDYGFENNYKYWPKDPIAAVRNALRSFEWTWPNAVTFVDRRGAEMHMSFGTPAMLEGFLARDFKDCLDQKVAMRRSEAGQRVSFETFRRVVRSKAKKALNAKERKCLIQWQAGALLTRTKLAAWGYDLGVASAGSKSALLCDLCKKQADTTEHRLLQCEEVDYITIEFMPKGLVHAMSCDPLSLTVQRGWLTCLPCPEPSAVDEVRTLPEGIDFEPFMPSEGPVYTDGSCFEGNWGNAARACFSAVQIDDEGDLTKAIYASVPAGSPQNAVMQSTWLRCRQQHTLRRSTR